MSDDDVAQVSSVNGEHPQHVMDDNIAEVERTPLLSRGEICIPLNF